MPKRAELHDANAESEKLTLNLGHVDLGRIDLLVREGFFANRSDFIRTAIRRQIEAHEAPIRQSVDHHALDLGLRRFTRADLEAARAAGRMLDIRVLGLAVIDGDVSVELARAAIGSITVLGALQADKQIKAALADRIR